MPQLQRTYTTDVSKYVANMSGDAQRNLPTVVVQFEEFSLKFEKVQEMVQFEKVRSSTSSAVIRISEFSSDDHSMSTSLRPISLILYTSTNSGVHGC